MRNLLLQIEKSLDADLYYLSLMAALTIPDIAAALDFPDRPDRRAIGPSYSVWYEKWVRPQLTRLPWPNVAPAVLEFIGEPKNPLTGEDCYHFRCSLLHQGSSQHAKSGFSRIIFFEPDRTTLVLHYERVQDALFIDLRYFCLEMLAGARQWLDQVESTDPFQTNYERFARRHPDGLLHIRGIPVIG